MSLSQTTDRGGSAIQIIPCTLVDGKLSDSFGTVVSFNVIGDAEFKYPLTGTAATDEVNEVQLINGITLQTPKITKKVDKSDNEIASASGGTGGTGHAIVVNVYEGDYDFMISLAALAGGVFIIWVPLGDRNHDGFAWLLCRFDGEASIKRSGNTFNSVSLTFVGKALELDSGATAAEVITALGTSVVSITQPGIAASAPANPLNPETNITSSNGMLVAADIANPGLLAGTLVYKKGA